MKQELLAPAGDIEAGYAALYYGADAVYLGLQKFSARATATNFDEAALNEFTAYAHHLRRKVYAAINTVLQEDELPELLETLDICSRCKIDAVILQDLGVARVIRKNYPELEMHASTQMAVHNKEGAIFLQHLGFSRVVLARELTLPEIKEIAAVPNLETEAFIHGALCYSYSGLCQFSSLETGRSANRGKCLYPCRACFEGEEGTKHIFSMKDMALQADILKMPVTSLKIEGRKKSALYVAAVTDYYRKILDGKSADIKLEDNIKQIFSRPWCKFHFNGRNKDIIDKNFVGHRGLLIGQIEKIVPNGIGLTIQHKIGRFDGLQIEVPDIEKPFGFSVQKIKVNGKNGVSAQAGDYVEIELPTKHPIFKPKMMVYLSSSGEVKGAYPYTKPKPDAFFNHTPVDVFVEVYPDKALVKCDNFSSEVTGSFEPALNFAKTQAAFEEAFQKTGGTPFQLSSLTLKNENNLFVPVSKINELRRDLYAKITPEYKKGRLPQTRIPRKINQPQWVIKTDSIHSLKLLDISKFAEIIYLLSPSSTIADIASLPKEKVRLALPTVCRHPQLYQKIINSMLENGYDKWEAGNYWSLNILPLKQINLSLDTPLYMLNSQAIEQAREFGAQRISLSIEDTLINLNKLAEKSSLQTTFVAYQDAPLFISAGCIRNNDCKNCTGGEKWINLRKDGRQYQALSKDCQVMLFDKAPLCFAAEALQIKADFYRIDFVHIPYTPEQVKAISDRLLSFNDLEIINKGNLNNQKI